MKEPKPDLTKQTDYSKDIQHIIDRQLKRERSLYPVRISNTTVIYVPKGKFKQANTPEYKEAYLKRMRGW